MRSFSGRDILSLKGFERNEYFRVFEVCDQLAPFARDRKKSDLLAEKILVTAFYQPSTRTRLAHEAAMLRLGGSVTGFSDAKMTRAGDFYAGFACRRPAWPLALKAVWLRFALFLPLRKGVA